MLFKTKAFVLKAGLEITGVIQIGAACVALETRERTFLERGQNTGDFLQNSVVDSELVTHVYWSHESLI